MTPDTVRTPGFTEAERTRAVEAGSALDLLPEATFNDVVGLVAEAFAAPIAAICLADGGSYRFQAAVGIGTREQSVAEAICAHAIRQDGLLILSDLHADERFAHDSQVNADAGLRFFAGAPIDTEAGDPIGTLCVLDRAPRAEGVTPWQQRLLLTLARQIGDELALHQALGSAEERYRLAARAINDAVWDWDFTTNHVTWNRALEHSYGHQLAEVEPTGDWWIAQIHPADRDRIDASIHAAIDGNAASWSDEYRFRRADGSYAAILDRGGIIRDAQGGAVRMIGAMLDLSERQEASERLAISEERLRLATEAADVGFWDVDMVNDRLVWPPVLKRMFGISGDAPITLADFYNGLHPDDLEATARAFEAACDPERRALYDVEYRTIGKDDGVIRWVAAKGRGLFDPDGGCRRVVGTAIDITERRRADETLRESEARLRFLRELDEALQGATDAPTAMHIAAERLARRLGVSRCAYADVDPDSDRFVILDDYVAPGVASSTGVYSLDLFGTRAVAAMRGGRTLVIRDVGRELDETDGRAMFRAIGVAAIICCPLLKDDRLAAMMAVHDAGPRDWTEAEIALVEATVERCWAHVQRVGAEARLRESEERYRTLFEAVDVGFCVIEMKFDGARALDYRFEEINPAFERQTGLVDAGGRWMRDLVPGHEQYWFDTYGEVARTGVPIRFENGSEAMQRWFDVHAFRVGTAGQNRVAILFNDITARKDAEDSLRELNETLERQVAERTAQIRQYRDIVEATASPICAFDNDYRLIAFNRAHNDEFRRVNGFDTKLGDVFPDLFIPEQRAVMRSLMDRALAGEHFTAVEQFGRAEYGQPLWEISYTPLRDDSGAIIGAFHLATDISDRIRAEEELAAAQEALRQSQKMEAMGSLTGGVAHDFNNLLTPIVGSLDMLQRKAVGTEREQRLIAGALHSAERAKTLVQRLLAFARRQPLQPRPVDVGALVHGMAELVASTSGPQIRFAIDVADDLPAAIADPNQLEMAVLNLSVNARDAMPDGGRLSITVQATQVGPGHATGLEPGRYVCLSVADTGIGMDGDTLKRAVEPFFSTKGIGKGTGLGLSMVHGLAAQLGGALAIDSRLGLGTSAALWLPASEAPAKGVARADEAAVDAGSGRVLLVDDEEMVRASTADMLTDLGYDVVEAGSAEEALHLLNQGLEPDLLVSDHLMPGQNGTELARELLRRLPRAQALIVSGYADVDGIAPDLPRLVKPFRQAELASAIQSLPPARRD